MLFLPLVLLLVGSLVMAQDWSAEPSFGSVELESGFLPDPERVDILAGGEVDLSEIGYTGYVAEAPDFDVYYEGDGSTLYIYVEQAEAGADTVLLVNAPTCSWHYNDDNNGVNPGVAFPNAESGLYDVWIGTFFEGELAETVLAISEIGFSAAGGDGSGPDWSADPSFGSVELSAGFESDPHTVSSLAGGESDLSSLGYYGFVAEAPDYDLYYQAGGDELYIYVRNQSEDTVLLVNDPTGSWHFSDDENGLMPGIRFANPESGLYDIWVGTVGIDLAEAELAISEAGW